MIGHSSLRPAFRKIWWVPLACLGVAMALSYTDTVQRAEWKSLDWRTEFRAGFQMPPDPRLALVLFDDQTEVMLETAWPVDRQYHAQLTQVLALAGAKLVAWDIILDATREGVGDVAFAEMAAAARDAGTEVLSAAVTSADPTGGGAGVLGPTRPLRDVQGDIARVVGDDFAFLPYPALREASGYGFADTPAGPDGIRREIPMVVRVGRDVYPALTLQIILTYLDVAPEAVRVRLGEAISFRSEGRERRVPIDEAGRLLVNYRYDYTKRESDFPLYNYGAMLIGLSEVFLEEKTPALPPPVMTDKIVIIGQTVTGKADIGPSPLNRLSPLSFVIANAVHNLLAEDYARKLPGWAGWIAMALVGYFGMPWLMHRSVAWAGTAVGVMLVVYSAVVVTLWVGLSWWLPWVAPLIGLMLLQGAVMGRRLWLEQKAKQEIKTMFGAYVSPEVVDRLIKADAQPELGGHLEEITAYFSDVQGFTTVSEQLAPGRVVELMNEYLTACTDIIQEEGGTLDKYIGDAVVAMFGAPEPLADHAYRACVASQRVQLKLEQLRAKWKQEGTKWPPEVAVLETRIGLNSGPCVIGNMGSRSRFSYTMMGDDVNLAARLESGATAWGVKSMCTEQTRRACEKYGADRVVFRPLGKIVVKGRVKAVPIFEIVGLRENVSESTLRCVEIFARGLEKYYARDWDGALACFTESAQFEPWRNPDPDAVANPSSLYIGLVENYRKYPPPEEWDGVYVMREKTAL
jgi:adenylate cyclase